MNDPIRYPCGCVNERRPTSGVLRNVVRCAQHRSERRDPATLGAGYYAECGVVRDGRPVPSNHVAELAEALGPLPAAPPEGIALEVGCGASPYVAAIRGAGYTYYGIDPSGWASDWMRAHHGAAVRRGRIEDWPPTLPAHDLILAAHVIEHLDDAPAAVARLAAMLAPGGELWIVVPDDSDPVNPDHNWTFTGPALRACLEAAGLAVVALEVRRHVARERFIYCRARRR